MTTLIDNLPITEMIEAIDQEKLHDAVRDCYESQTAVYPVGGGTSLDFGLPPKRDGIGLSLSKLNQVVDYPARDMTITVEAGITMEQLTGTLAKENQRLPIDVPNADRATLGGVLATNWNGPRRYGAGNLRDYVIGISAVDGTGRPFKGGGRVVKNVAGYDFCKLLTGSLGTLGVVTQVTLKLKPIPDSFLLVRCEVDNLDQAEQLLSELVHSETTPSAIELLTGQMWSDDSAVGDGQQISLVVALEGTATEVQWMESQLTKEWQQQGTSLAASLDGNAAKSFWSHLVEFPARESALSLKANVTPSGVTKMIAAARECDSNCSIQAHAGNGVVITHFPELPSDGISCAIVGKLQPIANALQGNLTVLSNPSKAELTHQSVWGGINAPFDLMKRVKQQFDPRDILNPGRFVYT